MNNTESSDPLYVDVCAHGAGWTWMYFEGGSCWLVATKAPGPLPIYSPALKTRSRSMIVDLVLRNCEVRWSRFFTSDESPPNANELLADEEKYIPSQLVHGVSDTRITSSTHPD